TDALVQSVTATGTVNPQDTVNVGTQVSGTLAELYVDYNSKVKKGQVLARLDPTSLQASLDQARASLAQSEAQASASAASAQGAAANVNAAQANAAAAQAALESAQAQIAKAQSANVLAQETLSRDRQLLAQGYISRSQFETDSSAAVAAQSGLAAAVIGVKQAQAQAAAQIATARANAAQAQGAGSTAQAGEAAIGIQAAQVRQAQYNLDHAVVTSPVDGTVIARDVSVGQTVAAGFQTPTLFSIATDLAKMEADLQVGEPDIGNVRPGDTVDFNVLAYPTRTFTGIVSQVRQNPTTVQNVVTYTTVVLVDNRDGALRPGMTANATIHVASLRGATIVPVAALQWRPSPEQASLVVGPDGRPFHRTQGAPNAGPSAAGAAQAGGSPWGNAGSSGGSTVVAGTHGRIFVSTADGKLRGIPVQIEMVSGTDAAVTPRRGTLAAGEQVVVGGGSPRSHGASTANNPFAPSRGARVPGGGGGRGFGG
ncbi:MAG: efflux RND transporter periplasmic adaptor subunit, partial [Candidatus Eremiobacteraeota bacterium]|nr:efflux RND transporter periplasmic adaptor subunit [Candidatus Eremiobacteraeota bacterium]